MMWIAKFGYELHGFRLTTKRPAESAIARPTEKTAKGSTKKAIAFSLDCLKLVYANASAKDIG